MSVEARLKELKIELPPPPKALGVYKLLVVHGNTATLSGHGPLNRDGSMIRGRVGAELDQQAGYDAARQTGLAMLATLRQELGSLDRVVRVLKLLGFVNSTNDFENQPAVINGCSELFAEVFGDDAGIGVRSALGTSILPGNIPVEIEGIFEINS